MENERTVSSSGLSKLAGIGVQAKDYKVGDTLTLIVQSYGGIHQYFEEMVLQPADRLIEIEIKSVKMVKKQEFIDA